MYCLDANVWIYFLGRPVSRRDPDIADVLVEHTF